MGQAAASAAPPQPQFGRFRVHDFQCTPVTGNGKAPAGQCSRFRVSDFVPYGSATGSAVNGGANAAGNGSNMNGNGSGSAGVASPTTAVEGGRSEAAQHRNVQYIQQPQSQQNIQPSPLLPRNIPSDIVLQQPAPTYRINPSDYPSEISWPLCRVLTCIQQNPTDLVNRIATALLTGPSLEPGSLLHHMLALYPLPLPPPPQPAPALTSTPAPKPPAPPPEEPGKRRRGRPSNKKTPEGPGQIVLAADPNARTNPSMAPVANMARGKEIHMHTCTRCLKLFNPALRATPASDPSNEATCAVKHQYPDLKSGLVRSVSKKRSSNKSTWIWRCCGREVPSHNDDPTVLPTKEEDTTNGWCFVGRHTTEPGVLEKLGLKPGKGKSINDLTDIGSPSIVSPPTPTTPGQTLPQNVPAPSMSPTLTPAQPSQQPQTNAQSPPKRPFSATEPTTTEQLPVKRKRGRPKGSKTRAKIGLPITDCSANILTPPDSSQSAISPTNQLLTEAHTASHDGTSQHLPQPSLWNHYAHDPNAAMITGASTVAGITATKIAGANVALVDTTSTGLSETDIGILVSATAAMTAQNQDIATSSTQIAMQQAPVKRGRGRPKGVRNGTGKAAMERKRVEEAARLKEERRRQEQETEHGREVKVDGEVEGVPDVDVEGIAVEALVGGGKIGGDPTGQSGHQQHQLHPRQEERNSGLQVNGMQTRGNVGKPPPPPQQQQQQQQHRQSHQHQNGFPHYQQSPQPRIQPQPQPQPQPSQQQPQQPQPQHRSPLLHRIPSRQSTQSPHLQPQTHQLQQQPPASGYRYNSPQQTLQKSQQQQKPAQSHSRLITPASSSSLSTMNHSSHSVNHNHGLQQQQQQHSPQMQQSHHASTTSSSPQLQHQHQHQQHTQLHRQQPSNHHQQQHQQHNQQQATQYQLSHITSDLPTVLADVGSGGGWFPGDSDEAWGGF